VKANELAHWQAERSFRFRITIIWHTQTLNLLASWSKPLNSNQRTIRECRSSFGRQALNTG